ncbi:ATPase [Cycloclasticus sp. 46_83_sub15_T18]|nr:ATPase [Cycloclasticus sp. 46_83_sub15_T18]OUR83557.1 ATPase [Cycloclasticus sp. 46_120_T64]
MSELSVKDIEQHLSQFIDPLTEQSIAKDKGLKNLTLVNGELRIDVVLGYPAAGIQKQLEADIATYLQQLDGVRSAEVSVSWKVKPHAVQKGTKPRNGVKNMIAVASGKGGVGKSTTSVNLALALQAEGARVGILDADIYGPSQPMMLGISGRPSSPDGRSIQPMAGHGLQVMSVGFLVDEDTPMILRGPMVTQALGQLLNDTNWDDLDYLIIDMPPGTGDIHLTLAQTVPVTGAVIVTTPQDIALIDAKKGLKMFEKVGIPVLGLIENMSLHICSNCQHEEAIFGQGGGEAMAKDFAVEFLGALPLDMSIRLSTDTGTPTVAAEPEGRIAAIYREMARNLAASLAVKAKDFSAKIPNIVIK